MTQIDMMWFQKISNLEKNTGNINSIYYIEYYLIYKYILCYYVMYFLLILHCSVRNLILFMYVMENMRNKRMLYSPIKINSKV